MGVVYHANYLTWFEIGRTEWVRRAGISYLDMEKKGLLLPVTDVEASFGKPAGYDDWVTVCTRVAELSAIRIRFESRIVGGDLTEAANGFVYEGDELPGDALVRGGTRHVWVKADGWRPIRLDREAPEWYAALKKLAQTGD